MSPVTALMTVLSSAGGSSRLSVFIFHRVLLERDPVFPTEVDAIQFDRMMVWVKTWFNVLPLDEAVRRLKTSRLPARCAAITFDDGYADNFFVAFPILQRHGLPATFFIATGFLDGGRMWNDTVIESVRASPLGIMDLSQLELGLYPIACSQQKRTAIDAIIGRIKYLPASQRTDLAGQIAQAAQIMPPDSLMMTSGQVREMHRAGMQIGAHTVSHPILARLSNEHARQEIYESKQFLEGLLGERVGLFAYPNGKPGEDYTPQTVDLVRGLGFDAAVSTQWGATGIGDDEFQIRRFTPWDRTRLGFAVRMLSNFRHA